MNDLRQLKAGLVSRAAGWWLMSFSVLRQVAKGRLPMVFTSAEDIESLRILKDGGWVKVSFSAPAGRGGTATVTELTALGRFAMQFVQPVDGGKP